MPDNDDSSRNDRNRPEDNPFIAFRRFADSQTSALLNTVFTLPATIANFNNAHHAREQCLFGHADPDKCEKLRDIESREAALRSEGRDLYRAGNMQAVLNKGDELLKLNHKADELRKDIVEEARSRDAHVADAPGEVDRVERRGNDRGQHWAWSWNWSYPQPFDEERHSSGEDDERRRERCRWRRRRSEDDLERSQELSRRQAEAMWEDMEKRMDNEQSRYSQPRVWSWSWSWPPPADAATREPTPNSREYNLWDEFVEGGEQLKRMAEEPFSLLADDYYSPVVLEEDADLRRAGVQWRDAFEDLVRADQRAPLIPAEKLGQSKNLPSEAWILRLLFSRFAAPSVPPKARDNLKRVPWEGEETNDEPSYEYAHDHEDQHDDPPTPKAEQGKFDNAQQETELDAYERLLNPVSASPESSKVGKPSVLSTLTTTERSVAPDGTVTTKIVLKKRFADGREESSETVHTHRGQDADGSAQDPWKDIQESQFPQASKQGNQEPVKDKTDKKRNGWFWSN